ncbi:MAG: NTP transferase domain-containing protein, partial [Pseudomonadota bacterium]
APEVDTIVRNKAADEGIASSIRVGLAVMDERAPNVDGLLIVQADMPNLTSAFVQHLCAVFRGSNGDEIIVPTTSDGGYRSPIIWPRSLFAELSRLSGDTGGRSILRKNAHRVRPVRAEDETVFLDIDTVDDLRYWRGQRR